MATKGSCCCCSVCGSPLPNDVSVCALCVCDNLCVTITGPHVPECPPGTGQCDCSERKVLLTWDSSICAYAGTVACGPLSVDLKFEVKKCTGGDCHLCLTSTCLGMNGTCPDDCVSFTAGLVDGCGGYIRDGDQEGGFSITWTVDASGCGDEECTSVTIKAECLEMTNPAGTGVDRLCVDCDCVCECVCFTYEEDACNPQTAKVCWVNDKWEATFTGCPGGDQTLTVTIERGDDGCCYWQLASSRGTVIDAQKKTGCPSIEESWSITLPGPGTGEGQLTVGCENCQNCGIVVCCCTNPLPQTLTATIHNIEQCICSEGVQVTLSLVETSTGVGGTGGAWQGDASFCDCMIRVRVECIPDAQCAWRLSLCTWGSDCGDFDARCSPLNVASSSQSCGGFSGSGCCDPLVQLFESDPGTDGCCCKEDPEFPSSHFCFVVTE